MQHFITIKPENLQTYKSLHTVQMCPYLPLVCIVHLLALSEGALGLKT